ncbi:MAG: class I SAM-dependent methyltransferase [Myxococcota bacterium]
MAYTFGDSDPAERRLALVARVFAPASEPFLTEVGRRGGRCAIDLGCGPGHTTPLVQRTLGCAETIGLDASPRYVAAARERAPEARFVAHHVLETPYPGAPADTIYARFLVSHLEDAEQAIGCFASQLAPGGRLLLDEVETIETEEPAFRDYLGHVAALLDAEGQQLYVGPRLAERFADEPRACHNALRRLPVDPVDAGGMFALNWETLRANPVIVSRTTAPEREALAHALSAHSEGRGAPAEITWGLRQVALEAR